MDISNKYDEFINLGLIQTTIDSKVAWPCTNSSPRMTDNQDSHVWLEIRKAFRSMQDAGMVPNVTLLPELSLPRTRIREFESLVGAFNTIAIAGVDYQLNETDKIAMNQGTVFVPRNFFKGHPSRYCTRIQFGKSYASPGEKRALQNLNPAWSFKGDGNVYVFDCERFGRFGVSICWDFMDIERAMMYRGQLQHLFVLAYNRDLSMFRSLAESLSRTVFCNVVICNTGHYGGSLVVAPYYEAPKRTIYAHNGSRLFTSQVIQLPVRDLVIAQQKEVPLISEKKETKMFKDPPPGIFFRQNLQLQPINIPELSN
ncbi:MAG: carbon-nitrogen hydrolase family protein [Desulfobacteraceae bacterium]|nr:carbon-nitrogen hydrolase family protein [Desulfobacteraceae bacterium]